VIEHAIDLGVARKRSVETRAVACLYSASSQVRELKLMKAIQKFKLAEPTEGQTG
jgi:transcription initiation factor TFIIIB Brf1 subunit/transcription initiation factor TFIIB